MKIPFLDLKWQYAPFKEQAIEAFLDVFENSRFIMNKSVKQLEDEFAKLHNAKHAIAVSSGTAALHASLLALGIKEGDEVITTPFTFIATSNTIATAGAKPVYVDIDNTFNMDVDQIEKKITEKTKAIMPVHLFGHPINMDKITEIAKKHGIYVIEDAAQSILAEYRGNSVGAIGDVGCFSLYPAKNLGAFGEGGVILTNNDEIANKLREKINNGIPVVGPKYISNTTGLNYRMNELTAALMLKYIGKLGEWNSKREENASYYDKELANIPGIKVPKKNLEVKHSYHQYTIRSKNRKALSEYLKQKEIDTCIFYPVPLHLMPAFKNLGYGKGDFPEVEIAAEEVLSLPIGPHLSRENLQRIVQEIKNFEEIE